METNWEFAVWDGKQVFHHINLKRSFVMPIIAYIKDNNFKQLKIL
jgi:predicted XRE-type DNA-binding protein